MNRSRLGRTATLALTLLASSPPALASPGAGPLPLAAVTPPNGFRLDGSIAEWLGTRFTVELGRESQVAGASRVRNERDFRARLWLALDQDGLLLAGEVNDDAVLLPTGPEDLLASDHVELWLAFPAPPMPPLGFGNQWSWTDLPDEAACTSEFSEWNEVALTGCKDWVEAQLERRRLLPRLFVHQYLLAPDSVRESFWSEARATLTENFPLPAESEAASCCDGDSARFIRTDRGYTFEARVPPEHLPATTKMPLVEVRVLLDVVDNDRGHEAQESFLSSSKHRRFGEPATFHPLVLPAPPRFESTPPMVAELLAMSDTHFVFPGRPVRRFHGWLNLYEGYQSQPEVDSPALLVTELAREPVARWGDLELYLAVEGWDEAGGWSHLRVFSFREGKPLGKLSLPGYCSDPKDAERSWELESEAHWGPDLLAEPDPGTAADARAFLLTCTVTRRPLASGAGGGSAEEVLAAFAVERGGTLRLLGAERTDGLAGRLAHVIAPLADGSGFMIDAIDFIGYGCKGDMDDPCSWWRTTFRWLDLRTATSLAGSIPQPLPRNRQAALIEAVVGSRIDEVRRLLESGADPNAHAPGSAPPLALAASRDETLVQLLLEHGADPNASFGSVKGSVVGLTPLHVAAAAGERLVVIALLAAGASPEAKTSAGLTPRDVAAEPVTDLLAPRP